MSKNITIASPKLRGGWHRARTELGRALRVLRSWGAERRDALEKANDDIEGGAWPTCKGGGSTSPRLKS